MPVKTRIAFFKPDALAIVTNEFNPKLQQGRHGDLIRNDRNFIQLKVPIRHRRCFQKTRHNAQGLRLGKIRMKKQIAATFEIAEIQAQRTAIYDGCSDRLLSVSSISQPYMSSAAKAYAAIPFIDRFKFNVSHQLLSRDGT